MADTTRQSDTILREAKTSLVTQRQGGYHRRARSIGRGSASLKTKHLKKKLGRILLAVAGVWLAASVIGLVIDGLGFAGLMGAVLATAAALFVFGNYPKMKVPRRSELNRGDVRQLVGRTELWLEHQRPALPPPAVALVDTIGVQLDALGMQLEHVDRDHPATAEIRKLIGEHLPQMVDSYGNIPAHLRNQQRGGSSPDEQLTESLGKISEEIDSVTCQLAEGSLDDLAIRTRYLDYRYGAKDQPAIEGPKDAA